MKSRGHVEGALEITKIREIVQENKRIVNCWIRSCTSLPASSARLFLLRRVEKAS